MRKYNNKKFGKLTATGKLKRENNITTRLCICECGKETWLPTSVLTNGHTKSCGCFQSEFRKLPPEEAVRNCILDDYKTDAKKRGLVWGITDIFFDELIGGYCYFCGVAPMTTRIARRMNGDFTYNGIDRLDNTKGYIDGNVVTCCRICNRAKSDMTLHSFEEWINKIKTYNA